MVQGLDIMSFQAECKPPEILWKKMRGDGCGVMDRSLSAGSLAGTGSRRHILVW